jgi:hypothetical protein
LKCGSHTRTTTSAPPPERSDRASTAIGPRRCWRSDCGLRQSDRPWTSGWRSDRQPERSDHPILRGFFIAYFVDLRRALRCANAFGCAPQGAHDSTCATRVLNVYDSTHASRSSGIPTLLTSPLGYTRVIGTASTLEVIAGEGRTGGTSGQPSSNDHVGEVGFLTTGRQTHIVDHLVVTALSSAHLRLRHPR